MKNRPQIQTSILIRMFQNIALALGGSITFRERALPSLGFWRLLSTPPKTLNFRPRARGIGTVDCPYSSFMLAQGQGEDRRFEDTINFDGRIKPHFVKLGPCYAKVFKFHWL